jgi:hypothetical protein
MADDQVLEREGQYALRQEVDRKGQPCTYTVRATDGGAAGQGDAVTVDISGFEPDGGPVRRGEVRLSR